ncbi:MAG: type VI secretion system protein TssA [Candidatus Polarisedimenticolaceae bacterium]|nr:type VI secretion system protein TssA [Candidatus Polarisedimenticolaceae bacterium]
MSAIDIENLLLEISSETPCGEDLEYDPAFVELERIATGKEEQQIGDSIIEAEEPEWKDVLKQSIALTARTKDLRILVHIIRSALKTEGYSGLRDGLLLLQGLMEKHWDSIYPLLDEEDDNDPTMRVNALSTIDDPSMIRPLRLAPLVSSKMLGCFSQRDHDIASGHLTPSGNTQMVEMKSINAAFLDADIDELQTTATAISESIDSLNTIENFVTEQVGVSSSVNFRDIRSLLKEAQLSLAEPLTQRGANSDSDELAATGDDGESIGSSQSGGGGSISGAVNTRNDVIRTLEKIEKYYQRSEPSSPIPLLIQRAKSMVNMNFMDIIQNMAPDGVSQVETIRGPKSEDSESQQGSSW